MIAANPPHEDGVQPGGVQQTVSSPRRAGRASRNTLWTSATATGDATGDMTGDVAGDTGREIIDLTEPADGLPTVIATADDLAAAVARLAAGSGPLAVDAERASGYRYGQRAYLVQLRRAGAGTVLIDPIACPDLSGLDAALADVEAVLHAASQDLPCLAEIGYQPRELFDTELAGRLLGYPRVALGTMLEEVLGFRLAKEHSAADWSVRPIPAEMLKYAALDVEVLVELHDALVAQLAEQDKTEWARQEFAAIAAAPPRHRAPTRGGAPRASTRCEPGGRSRWSGSCGRRGTRSPATPTCRRGGY